jgi:tryptophanyl-tRNA synthetase
MKRIFSGIQPTGDIHIGNYVGALKQWVALQDHYECVYGVVDYHAITIEYDRTEMAGRSFDTALILMACGLDPLKCHLMIQSHVIEHTELGWIFNCVTPIGEVERMTQFKDKSRQHRANINMGLMDYPVLQAADILVYKADFVPVGEDQVQHVELSREIARKFNARFTKIFPEPEAILSRAPRILGTEGKNKMSKSLNNYIGILEEESSVWEKLRTAVTDVARVRRTDKGNPDVCNVFTMHRAFSPEPVIAELDKACRTAAVGCIDCKKVLFKHMMEELLPIREKALSLREQPDAVKDALKAGAEACSRIARATMEEVREGLGLLRFP